MFSIKGIHVSKYNACLGATYMVVLLGCCREAIYYADSSTKLALAWLAAGVVASQVVIDLGKFESAQHKAWLSAGYRLLAVIIGLAAVYWVG
jgi:hypothetical protein